MGLQTLLELDARWSRRLRLGEDQSVLRRLAAILAHSGDSWFWFLGLGLVWYWGNAVWKTWALRLIAVIFVQAVLVMALKFSFRRSRPEGDWGRIYRHSDPHSFPSGHAARSAVLATFIVLAGPAWLAPILVLWAPLMSLARVAMGVHFLSDIAAGMVLGLAVGAVSFTLLV